MHLLDVVDGALSVLNIIAETRGLEDKRSLFS